MKEFGGPRKIYKVFDAKNCTLHSLNEDGSFLSLVGQIGLPEKIAEIAKIIPVGKEWLEYVLKKRACNDV